MAIKKSLTVTGAGYVAFENLYFETGETTVTTPALYIKVESVTGSKNKAQAIVTFTDQAKGKQLLEKSFAFTPAMDAGNFIAQAYDHLKTLPEFAGATDC
jgi:hypothetical protein